MRTALAAAALLLALVAPARADAPVVVTIKPLHSLVAGVMQGVGTPDLLIPGTTSPHTFSLKPSDARKLENAGVVFWIGHDLETALEHPLETLAAGAKVVSLMTAPGVTQRAFEEEHDHGAHDKHDKDDHGHGDHKEGAKEDDDHSGHGHAGHDHGPNDPHVWLDPDNGRAMVLAIAATLSEAMPEHRDTFSANADRLSAEIAALNSQVAALLEPVWYKPFLTFHDALGHFEAKFGLAAGEAITVNPEVKPGAKRVAEMRHEVAEEGIVCVFIEPQFNPSIAEVIVEGSTARIATLDPLGSAIEEGPTLYSTLILGIAQTLHDCLGAE